MGGGEVRVADRTTHPRDRVRITDEQDPTGRTTYQVVIDHMDHGVRLCSTTDRNHAQVIEFAVGHELECAYEQGKRDALGGSHA